jgi:hypothetical protein
MGMFKDLNNLNKQAKSMQKPEHRGLMGGFRQMKDGVAQANQIMGDLAADGEKANNLQANGHDGIATITAVRDTGMSVNENPSIEMDLQVQVGGGAPYAVTHQQVVSRIAIANFQPGASVAVKVDPADPQSLIVA